MVYPATIREHKRGMYMYNRGDVSGQTCKEKRVYNRQSVSRIPSTLSSPCSHQSQSTPQTNLTMKSRRSVPCEAREPSRARACTPPMKAGLQLRHRAPQWSCRGRDWAVGGQRPHRRKCEARYRRTNRRLLRLGGRRDMEGRERP